MIERAEKTPDLELSNGNRIMFEANADFIRECLRMHISKRQIHAYLRSRNRLDICYSSFARMCSLYLGSVDTRKNQPEAAGPARRQPGRSNGALFDYRPELAILPGYDR